MIDKKFFVFHIIAFEYVVLNCCYQEENTCHWQSMCSQTVLRFILSLKETVCNSITFTMIDKYGKGAAVQISNVFCLIYHVAC